MSGQSATKRTADAPQYRSENMHWKAKQTQNHARHALTGCLFDIDPAKIGDFFEKFLPLHKDVETKKVLAALVDAGYYNKQRACWPKLMLDWKSAAEKDFYPSFVEIATKATNLAIDAVSLTKASAPPSDVFSSLANPNPNDRPLVDWKDTHASPLFSSHYHETRLEPDIVSLRVPSVAKTPLDDGRIPWCDVLIPFEVKMHGGPVANLQALLQLVTYIEEVMRDQPHRRFCFGVQIVHGRAGVWLFNRSLGLRCTFDIHKVCRLLPYSSSSY
jgi:hypothetical protein